MPTLFELLSSEVGPQTTQARRPKWARSGAKRSPFGSAPVERETDAQVPAGARLQAGTDAGDETETDRGMLPVMDPAAFEADPIGSVAAAEKGGFFDSLQSLGAAAMMMSGDKEQSRLGLGLMQGQQRTKQFQQREKRLTGEAKVREQRLQANAKFDQQIKTAEATRAEIKSGLDTLDAMDKRPNEAREIALAFSQKASPIAGAIAVAGANAKTRSEVRLDAISGYLTARAEAYGAAAMKGGKDPKQILAAVTKQSPTTEALIQNLDRAGALSDLSPENRMFMLRNLDAVSERVGRNLGHPSTKAVLAAEQAGLTEKAQLEGKISTTGKMPGTPEGQALAEKMLLKSQVSIENKTEGEVGKGDAKFLQEIRKQGEDAAARAPIHRQLKTALESGAFTPGALGSSLRAPMSKLLSLVGVPGEKISPLIGSAATADTIRINSANLVNDLAKSTDNARLKMAFETLRDATVNLDTHPDAAKIALLTGERIDEWKRQRAGFANNYWRTYRDFYPDAKGPDGKPVPDFYTALSEFDDKNPVMVPELETMLEGAKKSAGTRWRSFSEAKSAISGSGETAPASTTEPPEGYELVPADELPEGVDPSRKFFRPVRR